MIEGQYVRLSVDPAGSVCSDDWDGSAECGGTPHPNAVGHATRATLHFDVSIKQGDPCVNLPKGTIQLSRFGERPVFSPDGKNIAFISKSYGDAYEYDIATHTVRNLTTHAPNAGYLRVHYLNEGNSILLGPLQNTGDRAQIRRSGIQMWFLAT